VGSTPDRIYDVVSDILKGPILTPGCLDRLMRGNLANEIILIARNVAAGKAPRHGVDSGYSSAVSPWQVFSAALHDPEVVPAINAMIEVVKPSRYWSPVHAENVWCYALESPAQALFMRGLVGGTAFLDKLVSEICDAVSRDGQLKYPYLRPNEQAVVLALLRRDREVLNAQLGRVERLSVGKYLDQAHARLEDDDSDNSAEAVLRELGSGILLMALLGSSEAGTRAEEVLRACDSSFDEQLGRLHETYRGCGSHATTATLEVSAGSIWALALTIIERLDLWRAHFGAYADRKIHGKGGGGDGAWIPDAALPHDLVMPEMKEPGFVDLNIRIAKNVRSWFQSQERTAFSPLPLVEDAVPPTKVEELIKAEIDQWLPGELDLALERLKKLMPGDNGRTTLLDREELLKSVHNEVCVFNTGLVARLFSRVLSCWSTFGEAEAKKTREVLRDHAELVLRELRCRLEPWLSEGEDSEKRFLLRREMDDRFAEMMLAAMGMVDELIKKELLRRRVQASAAGKTEPPDDDPSQDDQSENVFRADGSLCTFRFEGGDTKRIKCLKGMEYIYRILGTKMKGITALELVRSETSPGKASTSAKAAVTGMQGSEGSLGEVMDQKGLSRYRDELRALVKDIGEAEDANDLAALARLKDEKQALLARLSEARGLGGKVRSIGDKAEKARQSVKKALDYSYEKIKAEDEELSRHLRRHIHCGSFLIYSGDLAWNT